MAELSELEKKAITTFQRFNKISLRERAVALGRFLKINPFVSLFTGISALIVGYGLNSFYHQAFLANKQIFQGVSDAADSAKPLADTLGKNLLGVANGDAAILGSQFQAFATNVQSVAEKSGDPALRSLYETLTSNSSLFSRQIPGNEALSLLNQSRWTLNELLEKYGEYQSGYFATIASLAVAYICY